MLKNDLDFLKEKRDQLTKEYNKLIDAGKKEEAKKVGYELLKVNNIINKNS